MFLYSHYQLCTAKKVTDFSKLDIGYRHCVYLHLLEARIGSY